jgi:hypothetical protein
MRFPWALLIAVTGASSAHDAPENLAGQASGEAHGRSPSAFHVRSAIAELRIDRAGMVPAAVPRLGVEEECRDRPIAPTTSVGREIARRGWHVISEAHVGDHVAIAYVRGLLAGTSAMCFAVDGHVAIADRGRVVAIVSAARRDPTDGHDPDGEVHPDLIGYVYKVPGSGNFRITDGTGAGPPIAEIRISPDAIAVGRLARADSFCGGRVSIPNIRGRTIVSAARILRMSGWRPVNARLGLEDCQMTGLGFCGFRYRRGRQVLEITTGDEDHEVVDYEPQC